MAKKPAGNDWSRRLSDWYARIVRFRQPSQKKVDFQWCIEVDALITRSLKEHECIKDAVRNKRFLPSDAEIRITESGIKGIKKYYLTYKKIWESIVSNSLLLSRIAEIDFLDRKDCDEFISALVPGRQASAYILTYLRDYDRKQRGRAYDRQIYRHGQRQEPQEINPVNPQYYEPIWWAEPEPMPRVRSRLEVVREQQATLSERVALERHRDAFSNRGPQPRSDFRRFRN